MKTVLIKFDNGEIIQSNVSGLRQAKKYYIGREFAFWTGSGEVKAKAIEVKELKPASIWDQVISLSELGKAELEKHNRDKAKELIELRAELRK